MNSKQAKQLDFPSLLAKMGYHPTKGGVKSGGKEIWFCSPLNKNDKTPSFHLTKGSKVAWIFKCFSTGAGGTIIDFVIAHEGYASNDIKSALAFLSQRFPGALFEHKKVGVVKTSDPIILFPSHQQGTVIEDNITGSSVTDRQLEFLKDLPLYNGRLLAYLEEERKIPASIAQRYLRLVRYKNMKNGKTYFAIGMKNRAGGFEIRAASDEYSFKSVLISRDISVIKRKSNPVSVHVFEGMTDFLSFLVMEGTEVPSCDVVILHSVNSYSKSASYISGKGYKEIHTFLDNDDTGAKYTKRFINEFGRKVISHSSKFNPHKDLNDALKAGIEIDFFPNAKVQNEEFVLS